MRKQVVAALAAACLLTPLTVAAQRGNGGAPTGNGGGRSGSSHASTAPRASASRLTAALSIDGRLDEPAWQAARPATEFVQIDPTEGAPASERTEVRILYDDDAIYVGARLFDSGQIRSRLGRRDADLPDSDWFIVSFDGDHDHLTAARFSVNPAGVINDEIMTGSNTFGGDATWDPVWEAKTTRDANGWTAELRIPLSQLRFSRTPIESWGVQIERRIGRKNEHAVFAFTSRRERGGVARYGHLEGIGEITTRGRRLEILPFSLGKFDLRAVAQNAAVSFRNPYRDGSRQTFGAGGDFKFRPTSNITIDGAINPDFGQVELDPAVINLTAFETRFQEKRPFFIEGSDLFRFGGGDMGGPGGPGGRGGGGPGGMGGGGGGGPSSIVYSRRIGRSPQLAVPSDAAYSDVPEGTTILGSLKLTTRTANGWSIGLMNAVTQREDAKLITATQAERMAEVEPMANYFAGRVKRDMRSGQSSLGVISTMVNRSFGQDTNTLRLRSGAYTGGLDFRHEWNNRSWSFNGYVAGSHIQGTEPVLISAQRSSARYFQRPDAPHVRVDSSLTSMSGWAGRFDIGKRAGTWRGNAALSATSPGYEINDLGFQTSADRVTLDVNLNYEQTRPGKYFRRWNFRTGPDMNWNFGSEQTGLTFGFGGGGQFTNFWNFGYNYSHEFVSLDDRLTRGGVMAATPESNSGFVFLSTDSRRRYVGRLSINGATKSVGDWRISNGLSLNLRPGTNIELDVGPNFTRSRNTAQYLTTVTDAYATATAGRRFVFGDLEQTQFGVETRMNIAFTRALSLELYAQPLMTSGNYREIRQLRTARTFEFSRFGDAPSTVTRSADAKYQIDPDGAGPAASFTIADPDFDILSLRGNAVFRWEWRPGSTMYFVWQQQRSATYGPAGRTGIGVFDFATDGRDLAALRPDNIFMVKVTYWMNP